MGSKKRSVKSQPIRKRKKSKQVLAKVAERKEAQQQRLERKLAHADARLNAARLASLSLPTGSASQKTLITSNPNSQPKRRRVRDEEGVIEVSDGDSSDGQVDEMELDVDDLPENAFSQLVGDLAKPLLPSLKPKKTSWSQPGGKKTYATDPSSALKSSQFAEKNEDRKSVKQRFSEDKSEKTKAGTRHQFIDHIHENVDVENRAAAVRENAHFSHQLSSTDESTSPISSTYKTVAEWPRLKMSASSVTQEALVTLRELTQQESHPVSLGVQLTTLRRWQLHPSFHTAITTQERNPLLRGAAAAIRSFHDLLVCANVQPHIEDALRSLYVAHCVSHVLRCRARVLRNNITVNEKEGNDGDGVEGNDNVPDDDALRDRGFVRARVLILVPMRNIAYDVVKQIVLLTGGSLGEIQQEEMKNKCEVINQERFKQEFGLEEEEPDEEHQENIANDYGLQDVDASLRTKSTPSKDHDHIFRGNVDDDFKVGISLSKKAIKLFADFYDSDFIIASPLGLRRASAAKATGLDKHSRIMREKRKKDEDTEWKCGIDSKVEKQKKDDNDNGFLSSIEMCVIDGADVFSMQNWDTLQRTMSTVNNMPTCTRDTDFSRIREYFLDGLMKRFRQSIIFSRHRKSETMALFRQFENHAGKVQFVENPSEHGVMSSITFRIRQNFFKLPPSLSPALAPDARFNFFFAHTFPAIRAILDSQTLLVVPSYFDFVRVRNKLVTIQDDDSTFRFSSICEYSRSKDVVRARSMFFDRSISLLVITERFHFFWRHWIRGANTIVWYGLPENSHFYPEFLNMTEEAADADRSVQSLALYDQYDTFALERIVGPNRCRRMTSKNARSTYMFV